MRAPEAAPLDRAHALRCQPFADTLVERLGTFRLLSKADPAEIELGGPYDLIWSGSHLTHIEEDRWTAFVELFESVLTPGGVVVFTTMGRSVAEALRREGKGLGVEPEQIPGMLRDYDAHGFGFAPTGAIGGGDCLVSPAWLCRQLDAVPSLDLLLYLEHSWLAQDVIACARAPG